MNTPLIAAAAALVASIFAATPAQADHCEIAIQSNLNKRIVVTIGGNMKLLRAQETDPEDVDMHNSCSKDKELMFRVAACAENAAYQIKLTSTASDAMGTNLYHIKDPINDRRSALLDAEKKRCNP